MKDNDYIEYTEREYCKNLPCRIENELKNYPEDSDEYKRIRALCNGECLHTAKEMLHWLHQHGYKIMKPNY